MKGQYKVFILPLDATAHQAEVIICMHLLEYYVLTYGPTHQPLAYYTLLTLLLTHSLAH